MTRPHTTEGAQTMLRGGSLSARPRSTYWRHQPRSKLCGMGGFGMVAPEGRAQTADADEGAMLRMYPPEYASRAFSWSPVVNHHDPFAAHGLDSARARSRAAGDGESVAFPPPSRMGSADYSDIMVDRVVSAAAPPPYCGDGRPSTAPDRPDHRQLRALSSTPLGGAAAGALRVRLDKEAAAASLAAQQLAMMPRSMSQMLASASQSHHGGGGGGGMPTRELMSGLGVALPPSAAIANRGLRVSEVSLGRPIPPYYYKHYYENLCQ